MNKTGLLIMFFIILSCTLPAQEWKNITSVDAYKMITGPSTYLIDVRSIAEYEFVGHPAIATNIPYEFWREETMQMVLNSHFVRDVKFRFKKEDTLLLICRSGNRSPKASKLLVEAGFLHVFNIEDGFEGRKDIKGHRTVNGWKVDKLPYTYTTDPGRGYRYPDK